MDKRYSYLEAVLTLCVVFIHIRATCETQALQVAHSVLMTFCSSAVPIFFLLSGLFFFKNFCKASYLEKLKKRVFSLFIPYIVWNLLELIVCYLTYHTDITPRIFWDSSNFHVSTNILGLSTAIGSPINEPLWYVRDLMVLIAISPAIHFLIRKFGLWTVSIMAILTIFNLGVSISGFSLTGLFYFSLGGYLSIYEKDPFAITRKTVLFSCLCSISLLFLSSIYESIIIKNLYILCSVSMAFHIAESLSVAVKIQIDRGFLVFVYFSHWLLIFSVYKHLSFFPAIIRYFSVAVITILMCLAAYRILKRFTPGILKFLTGGR